MMFDTYTMENAIHHLPAQRGLQKEKGLQGA